MLFVNCYDITTIIVMIQTNRQGNIQKRLPFFPQFIISADYQLERHLKKIETLYISKFCPGFRKSKMAAAAILDFFKYQQIDEWYVISHRFWPDKNNESIIFMIRAKFNPLRWGQRYFFTKFGYFLGSTGPYI